MSEINYRLAQDVLLQKVAGEMVISEPKTGEYYTLNPIGSFIIEKFQQDHTKAEVIDLVLEKYQADDADVTQDIDMLLTQLLKKGLFISVNQQES